MNYLGVDIGGMSIKAGIIREDGSILRRDAVPTEVGKGDQIDILRRCIELCKRLVREEQLSLDDIAAVGVGSPGTPDVARGILIYAGNLNFRNCPIREILSEALRLPVFLANDANVAALAESRIGAGRGCKSSVTITIGTGLGGGVVLNDRVYAGFNGAGCEIGHMVIHTGGRPCTCGRKGCLEAYVAAPALISRTVEAAEAHPDSMLAALIRREGKVTGKTLFDGAKTGCPTAVNLLNDYLDDFAEGLGNVINLYLPEKIILGGGVSKQGESFRAELEKRVLEKSFIIGSLPTTQLALAELGNEAGIVGAGFYAKDCLEDDTEGGHEGNNPCAI